jgi:hypothetical protein
MSSSWRQQTAAGTLSGVRKSMTRKIRRIHPLPPCPQRNKEATDTLHPGAVEAPPTLERTSKTDAGCKMTDARKTRGGDKGYREQGTVSIEDRVRAGRNDSSAWRASFVIQEAADGDPPRRRPTETRRSGEEGELQLVATHPACRKRTAMTV